VGRLLNEAQPPPNRT